ncbi:MAG: pilus assembly protein [Myxococcaceae bacterium]|nr:pilus assembly protein [Myxococcaceae bacterium]
MRRGQATVELALFAMVFITVITFGIHFAEVGYLSIKVQEAANSALWDATSRKLHDTTTNDWDVYRSAISWTQSQSISRYADFNGLSSHPGPPRGGDRTMVQVFTNAEPIEVRCEVERDISMAPVRPVDAAIPLRETGMSCRAKAVLGGWRFPRWLMQNDQGGFFEAEQPQRKIAVCATGRQNPATGRCEQRFVIQLDDWGFSGSREARECPLTAGGERGCANSGYYDLVEKTYRSHVQREGDAFGTQSSALAREVVGSSPLQSADENHFYLSYRGNESSYTEDLGRSHGDTQWETTPFDDRREYRVIASPRSDCWLGLECQTR